MFEHWHQDPLSGELRRALCECISRHGPIRDSASVINSAVKRLYGVLKALDGGSLDAKRAKARLEVKP